MSDEPVSVQHTTVWVRARADSSRLPRWLTLLLLVALMLARTAPAHADRVRAHLTWQRPVGTMCPSSAELQADVELLLGRAAFVPREEADLWLRGVIEDRASGVHIQIDVRDDRDNLLGTRELSAPAGECASLRRALGVVLALLLDQSEVAPPQTTRRRSVALGASVGVLTATLPRADAGFGLALSLVAPAWLRVRADATYWLPVVKQTALGVGATFQAVRGGLSLCPRLWSSTVIGFWLCAGAQLGGLLTAPRKLAGPAHQARLLVQPGVELALALRVSRHSALEASVGALANVLRPTSVYTRRDGVEVEIYRPEILGAILRIGVTIE